MLLASNFCHRTPILLLKHKLSSFLASSSYSEWALRIWTKWRAVRHLTACLPTTMQQLWLLMGGLGWVVVVLLPQLLVPCLVRVPCLPKPVSRVFRSMLPKLLPPICCPSSLCLFPCCRGCCVSSRLVSFLLSPLPTAYDNRITFKRCLLDHTVLCYCFKNVHFVNTRTSLKFIWFVVLGSFFPRGLWEV